MITWRHAPQGAVGDAVGVYTATALSDVSPAETAVKIADRSAQLQSPNEAFSTFVPVYIFPEDISTAAPTGNFEYGE